MAHLADPHSRKKTFTLECSNTFVAFVDRSRDSKDATLSVLVFDREGKLSLKSYTYTNPFEKKDFTDENANWAIHCEIWAFDPKIEEVLRTENIKKVSLIE